MIAQATVNWNCRVMHSAGVRNTLSSHSSNLEQQRALASSYEVLMSITDFSINWWKLPMHHRWWSGNLIPAAGWPAGMWVPCMCSYEGCLILSCALPAACSSCCCGVFQLGNKKSAMYGFVFVIPGQWVRHNRDFLGTDFGSAPSSWFQGDRKSVV